MDEIVVTPEYEAVREALEVGSRIVFVSGRAGSGKSTLIRWLLDGLAWQAAVVAPTGIAALTVGGATIHSLLRLPPRLLGPDDVRRTSDRLFQKLRLLVIDEISMVRADVMDAVCRFLEINGPTPGTALGGIQLLLVGDLFQLPPVVDQAELGRFFRTHYRSPHFFSARALAESSLVSVELEHVFRQRETELTAVLNDLRVGRDVDDAIAILNARCSGGADEGGAPPPSDGGPRVVLTPTNHAADRRNAAALAEIPGPPVVYEAVVEGVFDAERERLPSPRNLGLKPGAQVMFTRNDPAKRWVNGTLGIVRELGADGVGVEIAFEPGAPIVEVEPVTWEKIRYRWNERAASIEKETVGFYSQLPLMLAWSTTIHKAQGQTLDAVEIDLGRGAFAPGQAYVALSRCRTMSGIRLTRPIRSEDVRCDPEIVRFYEALRRGEPFGEAETFDPH